MIKSNIINNMPVIVILGPTAAGKSDLAVSLAKEIEKNRLGGYEGAEIISADSRQVYEGLDIGTGKITKDEMCGVRHYCLDITNPYISEVNKRFTVVDWQKCAEKAITEIAQRNKIPIICGGTGFYISTLIYGLEFPDIEIDMKEKNTLDTKTADELLMELAKIDPRRAQDMSSNGDAKNIRRLVRAVLVARELGKVPLMKSVTLDNGTKHKYKPLIFGLILSDDVLKERIMTRILKRIDIGMLKEAERLHKNTSEKAGLSYERMDELGLEYRYLAQYLQGQLTKETLVSTLATKIWQYARRQKTWFKRDKNINWLNPTDPAVLKKMVNLINTEIKQIEKEVHKALLC